MNKTDTDVVVVGAGVIGLCSALALLQRGRSVTVLDQAAVGQGSSHGNCGTITPSHAFPLAAPGMVGQALRWMLQADAPLYIRPRIDPTLWAWLARFAARCNRRDWWASARAKASLLNHSRQALAQWVDDYRLDCEFSASGLVYAWRDPAQYRAALPIQQRLVDLGVAVEPWSADRLQAEEPALREGVAGGIHFPDDACLRPDRYVAGLQRAVLAAGGRIVEQCRVVRLLPEQPAAIAEDGQRYAGRDLLLACGAWTPVFARALRLPLPIQPGKGYSITYACPPQAPRRPLVLRERSVCVTAWGSGFRLGSTMEFSGYDRRLNRTRLDALVRASREYLRVPEGPQRQEEWYGWRPMTWDDLPLLGPVPTFPRTWLAAGHGMLGVSMSVASGQMMAAHIAGGEMAVDPTPYLPARMG